MFETYLTVVGRLVTDVTRRTTPSGDTMCGFRMVSTERRFEKESQVWRDGDRLFISVTCWRRLAENVAASIFKGDQVVVTGRLHLNEYEANGEQRSMLELEAKAVGPNLSTCTALLQRPVRETAESEQVITGSVSAA